MNKYYIAIDIGAGSGAKIGLFESTDKQIDETFLPSKDYGLIPDQLLNLLTTKIEEILKNNHIAFKNLRSIGIASPGLFRKDGSWLLPANLLFLKNYNLRKTLSDKFNIPVAIDNDANIGALAEWSVLKTELLYWVFGGGWGGCWITEDGKIKFSAIDWDGKDSSLHFSNEPGYAIPLEKEALRTLFYSVESSYSRFEELLLDELNLDSKNLLGPNDNPRTIRAESILSGPGRCRVFRAVVGDDNFYERFLNIHETSQMSDPSIAGQHISKLSSMRVDAAIKTDRLFGKCLALATQQLIQSVIKDGGREDMPICLGGKPSYALPYFGPSTQRSLGAKGIHNYMRPSILDERGGNANLTGAAVLAEQTYYSSR